MLCIDAMLYAARSTDSCILLLHTRGSAAIAAPPHRYDYTALGLQSPRAQRVLHSNSAGVFLHSGNAFLHYRRQSILHASVASYNNMIKSPRAYARQIFKTSSFLILNY